jgi:ketol-acid reductoisomerase
MSLSKNFFEQSKSAAYNTVLRACREAAENGKTSEMITNLEQTFEEHIKTLLMNEEFDVCILESSSPKCFDIVVSWTNA